MALTELQRPTKADFYRYLQHPASEMNCLIATWRDLGEFIANVDTTDLDAMGVATGQIRIDLVDLKVMIGEMIGFYGGSSVTPTKSPKSVIDKIRRM